MTSLFLVPPLAARPRGAFCIGTLVLGLAGCLPLPNDLGDTGSSDPTDGVETSLEPTDDTGPGPGPGPGGTTADDGIETSLEPTDTGPGPGPGSSTTDAADTEGDTDTDTDTDGEQPPNAFQCVLEEPCMTSYFGCSNHLGCEDEPPPVWGEGSLCLLELLRDVGSMPGTSAELNFERGGSPDWTWTEETFVLSGDGAVIHQIVVHSEKGPDNLSSMDRCALRAPEYFQACLDVPSWDCAESFNWMTDCEEIVELECPGS